MPQLVAGRHPAAFLDLPGSDRRPTCPFFHWKHKTSYTQWTAAAAAPHAAAAAAAAALHAAAAPAPVGYVVVNECNG